MTKLTKQKQKTRAQLEAEIKALKAHMPSSLLMAHDELKKTGCDRYMASGLIVTITNLSGKEVVTPFMCQDGLEQATIEALQAQCKKTNSLLQTLSL